MRAAPAPRRFQQYDESVHAAPPSPPRPSPNASGFERRGWNPNMWQARFTPDAQHPHAVDQRYLVNWNNKQARDFRCIRPRTPTRRCTGRTCSRTRVRAGIAGSRKLTLPRLIAAMEVAGTGDLRAHVDLPLALRVLGTPQRPGTARGRGETAGLAARRRAAQGRQPRRRVRAQRRDPDHGRLVAAVGGQAQSCRRSARRRSTGSTSTGRHRQRPNGHGDHLGSAYQGSWYGYVRKDLRTRPRSARPRPVLARVLRRRRTLPGRARPPSRPPLEGPRERGLRRRQGLRAAGKPATSGASTRSAAPHRWRVPAPDPLDQPPDLPAGERGPEAPAALSQAHRHALADSAVRDDRDRARRRRHGVGPDAPLPRIPHNAVGRPHPPLRRRRRTLPLHPPAASLSRRAAGGRAGHVGLQALAARRRTGVEGRCDGRSRRPRWSANGGRWGSGSNTRAQRHRHARSAAPRCSSSRGRGPLGSSRCRGRANSGQVKAAVDRAAGDSIIGRRGCTAKLPRADRFVLKHSPTVRERP